LGFRLCAEILYFTVLILANVLGFFSRKDPLQGDFPEVIEEYLHHGVTKCIAFNRRGTLLAGM